jgi:predicted PurR-regulated permease PerM
MFKRSNKKNELDIEKINDGVLLLNKILKILFIVLIVSIVILVTFLFKEWNIFGFIGKILRILIPFFIGFIIAWLFNPIVTFLCKHKFNRVSATILVYVVFIIILGLFITYSVPTLTSQLNEFMNILPKLSTTLKDSINDICNFLAPALNGNIDAVKNELFDSIVQVGKNITVGLPDKVFSIASAIVSGFGTLSISLFIGLYMLIDFDNVSRVLISFLPAKAREDARNLIDVSNKTLVNYIQGLLFTTILVWIGNSIGFSIAGLKASLLFALFCGVTNIIPYIGPWIGGIPAALVGFTQGVPTGIMVVISIVVVQLLDNVIFTPLVQSKGLKLHPVTIIIALLVFGDLFGIVGMIFAAPVVATLKTIFEYFNNKYEFIRLNEEIEEEIELQEKEDNSDEKE